MERVGREIDGLSRSKNRENGWMDEGSRRTSRTSAGSLSPVGYHFCLFLPLIDYSSFTTHSFFDVECVVIACSFSDSQALIAANSSVRSS
jgi:hypothetical protein